MFVGDVCWLVMFVGDVCWFVGGLSVSLMLLLMLLVCVVW